MPYAASRAAVQGAKAAPLPKVDWLQGMYDLGAFPRPGEVWMIAGTDGSLKSMLALQFAHTLDLRGIYVGADTAPAMTTERLVSLIVNMKTTDVAEQMQSPDMLEWFMLNLSRSKVMFEFDSAPSVGDIEQMVDAFVEMHDAFPEFLVLDSLMNLNHGGSVGDLQGERTMMEEAGRLARDYNCLVVMIHHTGQPSENDNPHYPPRKSKILNKLSKVPRLITTVAEPFDNGDYLVAIVKNTHGPNDPEAFKVRFKLTAYPEYAQFKKQMVTYG